MDRAGRVIAFIETLRTPDGSKVGQPLVLRDWQKDMIRAVYGPRDDAGRRIVRQAVFSAARKNGKTALVAGLCLCHLCGPEAVRNGQLYSVAFDREQASILYKYMTAMIHMDEELSERLNVVESRKKVYDRVSGSEFSALSSETKGKHGKSSSFIAYDELAQFGADRSLYDVMHTSTGAHEDPLEWVFSTQAPDDISVLSELIDYGKKVNAGEIEDLSFRAFIYEVPSDVEDIYDSSLWKQANPALGDFRSLKEMQDFAEKAKHMPSAEATFRNLYLNMRIDANAHFITPAVWKQNGGEVELEVFENNECFGGLDLSGKNDLTALIFVAQDDDGVWHVLPYFWTPLDSLRERETKDKAPYWTWKNQGFLEAKPGKTIDYRWIARKIGELQTKLYRIDGIKFDRWRIDDLRRALDDEGIDSWIDGVDWKPGGVSAMPDGLRLVPHGQGYRDMNPAVEILEDLFTDSMVRHAMHPVLTWCASNVRIQSDPAGNRKFDKLKSTGRIDGMVALAMALNGAQGSIPEPGEVTEGVFLL